MNYRVGFDIGIGSVGWSILEHDANEEPIRIVDMGVRIFDVAEIPKNGDSTASVRRGFRGVRRRRRRKQNRLQMMKNLIKQQFGIKDIDFRGEDIYQLRYMALSEKLSDNDIARILVYFANHRGYRSTRKSEVTSKDKETGKMLSGVRSNLKTMEEKGYRTYAEMVCKEPKYREEIGGNVFLKVRNSSGSYENTPLREKLIEELVLILETQQKLGNKKITTNFIERFKSRDSEAEELNLLWYQRPFDLGPDKQVNQKGQFEYSAKFKVGNCTFEKNEKRAPKASYTFEYFSTLQKINSLKILSNEGDRNLSNEERIRLLEKAMSSKKVTFAQVRKLIGNMKEDDTFNFCKYKSKKAKSKKNSDDSTKESEDIQNSPNNIIKDSEESKFVGAEKSISIRESVSSRQLSNDEIDEIALILALNKDDSAVEKEIQSCKKIGSLTSNDIERIQGLNFSGFGNLSQKAMRKIIPFMENGHRYDESANMAGYNFNDQSGTKTKYLKSEEIKEQIADIGSPVVRRAVNQTVRVLNAIIKQYGSPQRVNIELAREMSKTHKERDQIEKQNEENKKKNELAFKQIQENYGIISPKPFDILKYRLYNEQGGKCAYSQKTINPYDLFIENAVQVDHAIPRSRGLDDSFNNKVLVLTAENQNKGNQTPYEFLSKMEGRWESFLDFCESHYSYNKAKKQKLTKMRWTREDEEEFTNKNLNDTKYMSRFMLNLLQNNLLFAPSKSFSKKPVMAVNGRITSYMRKCWGLHKVREDGDLHHCVDACVISCVSDKMIQTITRFEKYKDSFMVSRNGNEKKYINRITGEVVNNLTSKDDLILVSEMKLFETLPKPYESFVDEIKARTEIDFNYRISDNQREMFEKAGYEQEEIDKIKPIFVSRAKRTKQTGAIHEATLKSTKHLEKFGVVTKKVRIEKLKLENIMEKIELKDDKYPEFSIKDYFNPQGDTLTYLTLKERLVEFGGKAADAFKDPVFKATKDGKPGSQIKSVKLAEKSNLNVAIDDVKAVADNDSMARIDVFKKKGKLYFVPVYMRDVYAKKIPNKICVAFKPYEQWKDVDETYEFMFSLAKNDLIRVKSKRPIVLSKTFKNDKSVLPDKISSDEFILYYIGAGISGAVITAITCDNSYKISSMGIQTMSIEKLNIDDLGKVYKAPKEERQL